MSAKRSVKARFSFFHGLGLRNCALGVIGSTPSPADTEFLCQNFMYNILKEKCHNTPFQIHYWRMAHQAEMDFVVDQTAHIVPVEVNYRALTKPETTRSFPSFLSAYHPDHGYVVHLGEESRQQTDQTQLRFIPYSQLFSPEL